MTSISAAQLENVDLHVAVDAGGMAHVHIEDDRRPLCFHRKLVTADVSTLPPSTTLPDAALCGVCRGVLKGAGANTSPHSERSPSRDHPRSSDTFPR